MRELHESWPTYDFARHKGYTTPEHTAALSEHGPCPQHRFSYVNVRASIASQASPTEPLRLDERMGVTA